ncbi:MAG TPA: glycosyltransferase WbuB, partial [Alcanivorax sp.]|nr:glycosyltransferase WbuB [Alcanivorax sp.]
LAYSNADGFLKRAGLFLLFALRSVLVALTRRYDVVFATSTPLTAGIPGIVARWLRGKRFVF